MKMKISLSCFVLFISLSNLLTAQDGIQLNTPEATPSYTLFEAEWVNETFLIDNCGEVVHSWDNANNMDLHPKLLPNGNLLYLKNSRVIELDWDGNMIASIVVPANDIELVYEVIKLPTGNYLCLGRKFFSISEFQALGFDPFSQSTPSVVDVVLELDAQSGQIVWEWNIADHVIQQRDPNAGNYGILADHPELLNMDAISTFDWNNYESFMINGMGYNPDLDQIVLSVRKISEIVVIDHSTTTEEAAGHTGGTYGKGGDILYRWGNPQNYDRGTAADRFLYFQHNPTWIMEGPHTGKMICYNNGLNRPGTPWGEGYSEIPVINTPVDANGNYPITAGNAFSPGVPELIYSDIATNTPFYSAYTSGVQMFPNGNLFITEGVDGRTFEITPTGEKIWEYTVPNQTYIFRAEKYPLDYPAFVGRDLTPTGDVPGGSNNYNCTLTTTSVDNYEYASEDFSIAYLDHQQIRITNNTGKAFLYQLFDTQGRLVLSGESTSADQQLSLNELAAGLYILGTTDLDKSQWISNKVLVR